MDTLHQWSRRHDMASDGVWHLSQRDLWRSLWSQLDAATEVTAANTCIARRRMLCRRVWVDISRSLNEGVQFFTCPREDGIEHRLREAAGLGILTARVIGSDQQDAFR